MIGTPYYISPEILNNHPYRFETDIWSLGVILYELMKLEPPFQAKSLQLLSLKIVKGKYDDPGMTYSKEIKTLLSGLLQVDPKRRAKLSDVLSHPLIRGRVNKYLPSEMLKDEFSHTVLHNQRINISKDKLQDQFKHLKVVNNENVAKKPEVSANIPKPDPPSKPLEQKKAAPEPVQKPPSGIAGSGSRPMGLGSGQGSRGSAAHLPVAHGQFDHMKHKHQDLGVQGGKIPLSAQPQSRIAAGQPSQVVAAPVRQVVQPPKPSAAEVKLQEEKQAYLRHVEELKAERQREMERNREVEERRKIEERRREQDKRLRKEKEERAKRLQVAEEQEMKAKLIQREREEEEVRKALEADEKRQKREQERLKMQEDIARRRKEQMATKPGENHLQSSEEIAYKPEVLAKHNQIKTPPLSKKVPSNQDARPSSKQQRQNQGSDSARYMGNGGKVASSPSQNMLKPPRVQEAVPKQIQSHQNLPKKPAIAPFKHKQPWVGVAEDAGLDFKESAGSRGSAARESPRKIEGSKKQHSDARIPTPNSKGKSSNDSDYTRLPRIPTPQRRSEQGSRRGSDAGEDSSNPLSSRANRKANKNFFECFDIGEAMRADPEKTNMAKTASFVEDNLGTASFHEFAEDIKEIHRASDQIANRFQQLDSRQLHVFEESPPDKYPKRSGSQTSGRGMMPMVTGVDMITVDKFSLFRSNREEKPCK